MNCFNNPPYYISAYALARKRGFKGTEDEWLKSLVPKVGIGSVETLDCGEPATVEVGGTAEAPLLNFGLPKGDDGCLIWKNTPFRIIRGVKKHTQLSWKADGTTVQQENCSAVVQCPKYLGWRLEGESRMWLYIGDMVDGEFVPDPAYMFHQSTSGAINYLNPSHNRFVETDGTKYFWYKVAVDEGVTLVGAEDFPAAMEAPAVVPDFVTNEGGHKTSGDYYSIVIPSGSDYAVLVTNHDTNTMNVSWDTAEGTVVTKGASFGSIPEDAGAVLIRIPNDCPLENVRVYCSKSVSVRAQRSAVQSIAEAVTKFQWTSRKGILWNDAKTTYFEENRRFIGVPYSSRWFNAHYLGYEISPTTLANALNDPYSVAYDGGKTAEGIWDVSKKTEIGSRGGPGYGLVCSVLQCLLMGNPYPQSNQGFTFDSNFHVEPASGLAPGAVLLNKSLSHSVLLDEMYDLGYSFVEAEDPCICKTVHTNDMKQPHYLGKKTAVSTLDNYAFTVANRDVSGYKTNLLDFDSIEIPEGKVRPWRGHKAVYGCYDKEPNSSGIGLTLHGTDVVRLFLPDTQEPVVFHTSVNDRYLEITEWVTQDGTYTVDSGEGTIQEQFRYFDREPISLHFTEDGTAVFSNPDAEYAYVTVEGYGSGYCPGEETEKNAADSSDGEDAKPMVIAAGSKYPDLAKDLTRIRKIRGVMMSDPTTIRIYDVEVRDSWGRFACLPEGKSSDYKEHTGTVEDKDLTGYATEEWVGENYQPKGQYLTEVPEGYAKTEEIPTRPEDIGAQPAGDYPLRNEIPTVPVQSVNGKTGSVELKAADVGALPSSYVPPDQTAQQVGADPVGTASSAVAGHNTDTDAHGDIRLLLKSLSDRLTAFFDSDDKTLDELSEIVAYITSNKSLIDSITTSKVSVSDIVNNLTTNVSNKPLSAAQGVVLAGLINTLSNSLSGYQPKGDYALKSELPAVPVKSVNNKTGDVKVNASDVGADPSGTAANAVSAHNQSKEAHPDIWESVRQLSENKANKQGLSLGVGSDGLVYLFADGTAQGNGLDIKAEAVAGDVVGYVDENNTIILTGALADGTYTLKYKNSEGETTDIGNLLVGSAPTYINRLDEVGYQTGYRLSSSGNVDPVSGTNPTFVTGNIRINDGQVVRLKNCFIDVDGINGFNSADTTAYYGKAVNSLYIMMYNDAGGTLNAITWYNLESSGYFSDIVKDSNGHITQFKINRNTIHHIRFTLGGDAPNAILTLDQEITD